jgi:hypothetical protein
MIDALLSKLGIPSLPAGDPILSILEAAAQSDLRTSQDIFQLLSSITLDKATGTALERIGADDGLEKLPESPSSGYVTISDTSFTKKQTSIFQGTPAPIVGSATIKVVDALGWPASGSIYIGRGTNQYEGPLDYTSITPTGNYYTINLDVGNYTQKFHNLGEKVVLAQGGDRVISAGTVVETPQGNTGDATQFSVLYSATIPDGETEINSVSVVCTVPGIIGNISAGAITGFPTSPFVGAAVTNETPFNNGIAAEDDKTFKERIKAVRQSRSRGTPLAIKTAVNGASSLEENKRIVSSSVVTRENYPTTLYIDDGSGYEEKNEGVPYEVLVESAFGGEQYFSLSNGRPVAKAFITTHLTAPFNLSSGSKLAVKISGVTYEHTFSADDFNSIGNASAYEVVASINGNPNTKFDARTSNNGSTIDIFADADSNEDIEVVNVTVGVDANESLGFPTGKVDTLRLYKNDILLNKDGSLAIIYSNPQSAWSTLTGTQTIQIIVDGVDISGISNTYSIADADFVNAGTVYNSVSNTNSLESWAQVLEYKIPGIKAAVVGGAITLTSNLGYSAEASITILSGTLVSNNMFEISSSLGTNKDYTLNRNLGLIRLENSKILAAGDRLTVGSVNIRSFIESSALGTINLLSDAELWFCVDGNATLINTGIQAGTQVTYSVTSSPSWGDRVRATFTTAVFANTLVGDWIIVNDSALGSGDKGAFRIVRKDPSNLWIEIERPTAYTASGATTLIEGGFKVVRTATEPQRVVIPTGSNYTALTLVQQLNAQLRGASAYVYKTTKVRVKTNTFNIDGDVAFVAVNTEGQKLQLPISSAVNTTSHTASVLTGNKQAGTPGVFSLRTVTNAISDTQIDGASLANVDPGNLIVATRPDIAGTADGLGRYSNHTHVSSIDNISGNTITIRNAPLQDWLPEDLVYDAKPFALNSSDSLIVLVDEDVLSKRYNINTYRKVKPTTAVYGATNKFSDVDNSNNSLAVGFGLAFDWNDFAVWMKARTKSHLSGGLNTTKTILWRYYRHGPEGEVARLQYRYPAEANKTTSVETEANIGANTNVKVVLPSSVQRTGYTIRSSTKIGCAATSVTSGLYTHYYVLGFNIDSASRTTNVTTLTLGLPGPITNHGLAIGNQIYVTSTSGSFSSGVKTLTGVSATTISYAETAADAGPIVNIGSVSFDTAGEAKLTGSTVIAGDIWGVISGTGLVAPFSPNATKIWTLDPSGRYWQTTTDVVSGTSTTLSWYQVNDTSKISFHPVNSGTNAASSITSAVNLLTNSSVSAVAVGGGAGLIEYATYEASPNGEGATDPWYYLTDGINYVRSNNLTPLLVTSHYEFQFKKSITSTLAVSSDWENEDVRLAPTTAKNVTDYLNSTTTSGLSSVAEIIIADNGNSPQISSKTSGSAGSVQAQGGSANALSSTIKNSATRIGSTQYAIASFPTADLAGLSGGMYVSLENALVVPKVGRITSATTLSTLDANGNFTLSGTNAWDYATTSPGVVGPNTWQFIKQGRYVQVRAWGGASFAGVEEGDIVIVSSTGSSGNSGTFRVIRQYNNTVFWIENSNAVEETVTATMVFLDYNSILPGDTLSINTSLWGVNNIGSYVVETIDLPSPFGGTGNQFKFKVDAVTSPVTGPITLGSSFSLVQVIEGATSKLLKKVTGISPSQTDTAATDVKFDSYQGYEKVGAFAGTILKPVDKLAFPIDIADGVDGYLHSTGLIAEANKIIYGVESDPGSYPGIVAAGAKVNIAGPLVKRIQISLGIRPQSNVDIESIFSSVRSEVASVINNSGIGSPISISEIVKAAQGVNGVVAVSVISPTYSTSNDLISVQPFEKPLVLNIDTDISVSLVGD